MDDSNVLSRTRVTEARLPVSKAKFGAVALVLFAALGCATSALAQSAFNYWSRCTDAKLMPERRIDYCTRLLDNGGGPDSEIVVLTVLGGLNRDTHQYAKAIDAYTRAVGYEALGVSNTQEAVEAPGSTISLPTSTALIGALEGRAEAYAISGQPDKALADTAHIFRLAPDAATSWAIRCRIRAIMKTDLDKAESDCGQAMKLDPKNTQVLGAAGLLQFQLGHMKDATADFDRALGVSPDLAGALYMRGVIELHAGNSTAGNADIAAATAQDPVIADNFSDLGIRP
jgi:tetratricopeptide (TPR) repeat protein